MAVNQLCEEVGRGLHVHTQIHKPFPRTRVKGVELKRGSENGPVMEGALFIYLHKSTHLYVCPYNFMVVSACTKMLKDLARSLWKKRKARRTFSVSSPCTGFCAFSLCGCTEHRRGNRSSRSSACKTCRDTRFSKVN